ALAGAGDRRWVGPLLQQVVDYVPESAPGSVMQRRVAIEIPLIHVRAKLLNEETQRWNPAIRHMPLRITGARDLRSAVPGRDVNREYTGSPWRNRRKPR